MGLRAYIIGVTAVGTVKSRQLTSIVSSNGGIDEIKQSLVGQRDDSPQRCHLTVLLLVRNSHSCPARGHKAEVRLLHETDAKLPRTGSS